MTSIQKWLLVIAAWVGAFALVSASFNGRYQHIKPSRDGSLCRFDTRTGNHYEKVNGQWQSIAFDVAVINSTT